MTYVIYGFLAFVVLLSSFADTVFSAASTASYAAIFLILVFISYASGGRYNKYALLYVMFLITAAACCYALIWNGFDHYILYVSALLALVVVSFEQQHGVNVVEKALRVLIPIVLLLAVFEFVTESYLFVLEKEGSVLDEKLFAGGGDLFRAKARFYGPLTLGKFCILAAIITRKNNVFPVLCLLASITTQSRTAMGLCLVIVLYNSLHNDNFKTILLKLGGPILAFLLFFPVEQISMDRIASGVDVTDNTNAARAFYWITSIQYYLTYDLLYLIFGNSGDWASYSDGAPTESAVIYTLLEGGAFLLLLLLIPLVRAGLDREFWFYAVLIFIAGNVNMFFYGRMSSFFFMYVLLSEWMAKRERDKVGYTAADRSR